MAKLETLLQPGETIAETIVSGFDNSYNPDVDYSIHVLERPGLKAGDEVLLEIRGSAEPCVLIGGNPLKLGVVHGFGRLAMVNLATGEISNAILEEGAEVEVPTNNTLYWYENKGDEPLVVRDHCDDFDPTNEPELPGVVQALINL